MAFAAAGAFAKDAKKNEVSLVLGTGVVGGLCSAPIYVALDKGYFAEEA
jgi:ABC-type nitrate/sulfonate/bicarbonate transport system substrate-binding protein